MDTDLHETPRAAAAYARFCSLSPSSRSLATLVEAFYAEPASTKRSPSLHQKFTESKLRQVKTWSSQYHWQERVKTYDQEHEAEYRQREEAEREQKRRERDAAIEEMNTRHIVLAMEQQEKIAANINSLISTGNFGAIASVQALKLVTDLERLARGEATTIERNEGATEVKVVYVNDWREKSADSTPADAASGANNSPPPGPAIQLVERWEEMEEDDAGDGNQRRGRTAG